MGFTRFCDVLALFAVACSTLPTLPFPTAHTTCNYCDTFERPLQDDSYKVGNFLLELVYNTDGYKNCSQEENVKLVRSFLYDLIPLLADNLGEPNPTLPSEPPFHISCSPQEELGRKFESQVIDLIIGFRQTERCGCPVRKPLESLLSLAYEFLKIVNEALDQ
ncbi:hypothetical protein L596_008930 [Steinernema carpocapsae]|uniref:Interleukin n=1 Tax=Steinernema carpocapsae TaxID=34508 RepID=A0A4U5PE50_STECR|nr:hypothetical protein L596_008930 [Steinernema carpocapsae]